MPMDDFRLRPLAPEETAIARNIIETVWPEPLTAPAQGEIEHLPQSFRQAGGEFWMAEYRQAAVGTVGVVPRGNGDWEVRWLCLLPRWQRTGLGILLLQRALAFAKERRGQRVLCSPPNEAARHFLRAAGFFNSESSDHGPMALEMALASE